MIILASVSAAIQNPVRNQKEGTSIESGFLGKDNFGNFIAFYLYYYYTICIYKESTSYYATRDN